MVAAPTRLTFLQSSGSFPIWSPDSRRVIFTSGSGLETLYEKAANGTGNEKVLLKQPQQPMIPTSWSRDGHFVLYHTGPGGKTGNDLWVLPLEGDRKPRLLLGMQFNEQNGGFSPDGRWIAYSSTESGGSEIYVRPFVASGPSLGEGKWQVPKDGTVNRPPHWRNDGKEIIFSGLNGSPVAVEVDGSGAAFEWQLPKQLFQAPPNSGWDVTGDDQKFLMLLSPSQQAQQNDQTPLTVVLNWQADLKK